MPEKSCNASYQELYSIQDRILKVLEGTGPVFYLTGGTALSRFDLHHRYSDDLDFFTHDESRFVDTVTRTVAALRDIGISVEVETLGRDFARVMTSGKYPRGDLLLKIDFVNEKDIPRFGDLLVYREFSRVDNWRNILSNKITALPRQEAKDVADVWFICRKYPFRWDEIMREAECKEAVEEMLIADLLRTFPEEELSGIKWVRPISLEGFRQDRDRILRDIVTKRGNSLAGSDA